MRKLVITLLSAATFIAPLAMAGDIEAGKAKAAVCSSCHGPAGISIAPIWPNLAGQKEQYLVKQIKAFRDGVRQDPTMQPMVGNLSDTDIDNLAAYYSSLSCQ